MMRSYRKMKISISRRLRIFLAALVLMMLVPAGYFGVYMPVQGNFHPITPGEAYRSAKLNREKLEHYIKKYNIKSIVNLIGEDKRKAWYQEELQVSAVHNIRHYDISLSATEAPAAADAQRLVEIFRTAPRPVLIHCKGGSDRSGLAAAMWKVIVDKEPKSEARKQLSIIYGHLPIGKTAALDHFFDQWEPALQH
jgi:protein tyrosine/serine phosphatase